METLTALSGHLPHWALASLLALASTLFMLVCKRIILGRLQRVISHTRYFYDSLLLESFRQPLTLFIIVINLLIFQYLMHHLAGPNASLDEVVRTLMQLLLVLAVVLLADRFCTGSLMRYAEGAETFRGSQSIIRGVTHAIILGIGLLVLLGTLGISITPIIASLGIGSLAVALALQPTLENFFSGVQLLMDKPIRVGDFIELDSGEQGFVEKIGWRSTWIKMLPNNTVIMPNSKLSQSKIINYFYPEKELSVPVDVGVHYDSDLEHVERVTLEVAHEVLVQHEWGVGDYNTFVVFHTFDNFSINFTVMLRTQEYFHRFFVKSLFIKALHKRYAEEGIIIPYPISALNTEQENSRFRWHNATGRSAPAEPLRPEQEGAVVARGGK